VGNAPGEPLLTPEQVKAYYESTALDLSVLSKVNFRHFRFHMADDSFYKVPRKIWQWIDLKKHFLEKIPMDVYYSSACWLNPQKLGSRKGGKYLIT
jgi:DNA primase catalytic subunit